MSITLRGSTGISSTGNVVTANNVTATGNVTAAYFIGNGSQLTGITTGGSYSNANVTAYAESGWTGNIIPSIDANYSLGNNSRQWGELWVANSTIYIGGISLGITGNTLTVAGQPVLSNDSNSSITTTGNITANYFIGNGSQITGLPSSYSNANVAAYLPTYTGNLAAGNILTNNYLYANGEPFVSASTGNITFSDTTISAPDDSTIRVEAKNDDGVVTAQLTLDSDDRIARLESSTINNQSFFEGSDFTSSSWTVEFGSNVLVINGAQSIYNFVDSQGTSWDRGNNKTFSWNDGDQRVEFTGYSWDDGNNVLTLNVGSEYPPPEDPTVVTSIIFDWLITSRISVDSYDNEAVEIFGRGIPVEVETDRRFDVDADSIRLYSRADDESYIRLYAGDYVRIRTNDYPDTSGTNTWEFTPDGNLTVPNSSVITATSGYITIGSGDGSGLLIGAGGALFNADNSNFVIYGNLSDPGASITIPSNDSIANGTALAIENQTSNVEISSAGNTWRFDNQGALSVPGNINFGGDASAAPSLNDFASITSAANFAVVINSADSAPAWSFETGDGALGEFDDSPLLRTPAGNGSVIYNETQLAMLAGNIDAGERSSVRLEDGGIALLGTTSLDGELSTIILEVNTGGVGIRALGDAAPRLSVVGNIAGGNINTGGQILATGNVIANNVSTGNVVATRLQNDANLVIRSNVAGTLRNWTFDTLGDLNLPFGGNIVGSGGISSNIGTFSSTLSGSILVSTNSVGDEGGEIRLAASENATVNGVIIDSYNDVVRIFENGGSSRGVRVDLAKAPVGNNGELMWKVSGVVNAGVFVTLDNLKATVPTTGNRGLSIAAVSGSFSANIGAWYGGSGGVGGDSVNNLSVTTTESGSLFSWNFVAEGNSAQYTIYDKTNNRMYRVTLMIGPAYLDNFISIERLL
jgi:hypothetical protein